MKTTTRRLIIQQDELVRLKQEAEAAREILKQAKAQFRAGDSHATFSKQTIKALFGEI